MTVKEGDSVRGKKPETFVSLFVIKQEKKRIQCIGNWRGNSPYSSPLMLGITTFLPLL